MKLLLDSCLGLRLCRALEAYGYDVAHVPELGPDPGDRAVLARAYAEQRVLITLDSDYGWLAVAERLPHVGIVRLLEDAPERQATLCRHVLERYAAELAQGALVTATMDKVRIRPSG
ncbi:MAG TPA: DUF5615 family PIN-like protein [Oscillatoriaceae cyanobacterium]